MLKMYMNFCAWICRCGIGNKEEETKCSKCGRGREL